MTNVGTRDQRSPDKPNDRQQAGRPARSRPPDSESRLLTPAAAGVSVLQRAAAAGVLGGVLIAVISRSFVDIGAGSGVSTGGLVIGVLIALIATGSLVAPTTGKVVPGMVIAALAVASVPISLGGLLLGSLCSLFAGAILVAYDPPKGPVRVNTIRARATQRAGALTVDAGLALGVQQAFHRWTGPDQVGVLDVATAWTLAWVLVFLAPSLATTRTVGRLVADTRLVSPGANCDDLDPPPLLAILLREIVRGVLAIGGVLGVVELVLSGVTLPIALGTIASALALVSALLGHDRVDELLRSEVVHDDLINTDHGPKPWVSEARS